MHLLISETDLRSYYCHQQFFSMKVLKVDLERVIEVSFN